MSLEVPPAISTDRLPEPIPTPPMPPENTTIRRAIRVVLAAMGFVLLSAVLAVAALVFGGSSDDGVETRAAEQTTAPVSAAPVERPAVDSTSASATIDDPAALLLAFGEAWRTANWAQMQTLATPGVVATAQEWFSEDGYPSITTDNMQAVLDTCMAVGSGGVQCQFIYAPPEGYGLIFDATYTEGAAGLMLSQLSFGGDAG